MALKIKTLKEQKEQEGIMDYYISDRRLYLNKDKTEICGEGTPEAATLYATPGTRIPATAVEEFQIEGLKKESEIAEDKALAISENKAVVAKADKKKTAKKATKKKGR